MTQRKEAEGNGSKISIPLVVAIALAIQIFGGGWFLRSLQAEFEAEIADIRNQLHHLQWQLGMSEEGQGRVIYRRQSYGPEP